MTRRRAFWPGQSGQSVPPGFLGDDDGERSGPAVTWRAVDHPLYVDDVEHGPDTRARDEPDDFAPYDRYGRFDDAYRFDDLDRGGYDDDGYDDGLDRYELAGPDRLDPHDADPSDPSDRADHADPVDHDDPADHHTPGVYRFDDLTGYVGTDPTEPEDGGRRRRGLRNRKGPDDAGSVLRDILVDRDDYRVEPRPRREKRTPWRLALAERLVAAWPGQSEDGAPPGFPASGELVLHPPSPRPVPAGGTLVHLPVRGQRPGDGEAASEAGDDERDGAAGIDDQDRDGDGDRLDRPARTGAAVTTGRFGDRRPVGDEPDADDTDDSGSADGAAAFGRRERVPSRRRSPRSLQKVAMAVYAALADPIANADPETRERRTLQVRRFGVLAGSAALAVVLIYAIFPVRTYLEQRAASQRTSERREKLREANAELEQLEDELQDPETVIEIARRDYQLVFPGEESYGLLPPPVPPTTTTTTTSPDG